MQGSRIRVCTSSTLFVSDRVLDPVDCSGLRMFSRVPSVVFKGGNAVRVPPRARGIPSSGEICFDVCTKLAVVSSDGLCRGLWLGRRAGLFRWVGGGVRTLADGGPSRCIGPDLGSPAPVFILPKAVCTVSTLMSFFACSRLGSSWLGKAKAVDRATEATGRHQAHSCKRCLLRHAIRTLRLYFRIRSEVV
jgi:hypothetical protein